MSCSLEVTAFDAFSSRFLTFSDLHISQYNACTAMCLIVNFKHHLCIPYYGGRGCSSLRLPSPLLLFYLPNMIRLKFLANFIVSVSIPMLCRYSYKSIITYYGSFPLLLLVFFLKLIIANLSNCFQ